MIMSRNIIPVILVSARDATAAAKIISDLIDSETPRVGEDGRNETDNVWRIINKYYKVDVRLVPTTDAHDDSQQLHIDEDYIEAHIIYLTEDECTSSGVVQAAEARARRCDAAHLNLHVHLVLAAAAPTQDLRLWAQRAHYELVSLADDGEGDEESHGLTRAREALHAHTWRGLERVERVEGADPGTAEAVERADQFAAALGALGPAAAATRALQGEARLDAAEELVAAFCRALGLPADLDDC